VKPYLTLAQARTAGGSELTLHSSDSHFFLRVNRQPLMGTNAAESEKMLAGLACERLTGKSPRVLIGGLGFGFTLRRVLELAGKGAIVHVAELLPEVVAWNREFLGAVNGLLLDDPRVEVFVTDVYEMIARAPAASYDAILLDVDNGPVAMVQEGNARLYHAAGFDVITRALKPGGRVAFWSATPDAAFVKRLSKAGFTVATVSAKAYPQAKRCSHTIFVADRKGR
jgi:spermidine synthase